MSCYICLDEEFSPFKNCKELFQKWGLDGNFKVVKFSFDKSFDSSFFNEFFSNTNVKTALHKQTDIRIGNIEKIEYEEMLTTATNMSFITEQLKSGGVVTRSGAILGRFEDDYEGIPLYDLLRESLVMNESEHYNIFSLSDRKELLFCIFSACVIGGSINQYEDNIENYVNVTREIYKELLSVRKDESGDITVVSKAFNIKDIPNSVIFPKEHKSNFCYCVVDPVGRTLSVLYYAFKSFW
eukprot:GHVL01020761.1.p1 GENE.GHVL01020761.1~~GHVL01020761.1.p1  ORF type:complete len:240 (-),score=30.79 GHVL01020761.1:851-1570(-)